MATYKEIKGVTVQTRQRIQFKCRILVISGRLNTARYNGGAGNCSSLFGGLPPAVKNITNGTSWTELTDLNR